MLKGDCGGSVIINKYLITMYIKEFDRWNESKKLIDSRNENHISSFRERDIWWCSIGVNIGSEEDGKNTLFERPVLVLKKFNNRMAWIIPVTSRMKNGKYYFNFDNEVVLLSHIRFVSVKRFNRFIKRISTYDFSLIRWSLCDLINFD